MTDRPVDTMRTGTVFRWERRNCAAGWPADRPISRDQHSSASSVESSTNSRTAGRPAAAARIVSTTIFSWASNDFAPLSDKVWKSLHGPGPFCSS